MKEEALKDLMKFLHNFPLNLCRESDGLREGLREFMRRKRVMRMGGGREWMTTKKRKEKQENARGKREEIKGNVGELMRKRIY